MPSKIYTWKLNFVNDNVFTFLHQLKEVHEMPYKLYAWLKGLWNKKSYVNGVYLH
jgi:hypothetical protein